MRADEITILVLNWRRADETLGCLRSIDAATTGGASVLVVDNGSHDGSVERLRRERPGLEILELAQNQGFAGGCNAGIRRALEAGAGGVLLLNNDARVAPDFLDPLLDAMNSSPTCGAVAAAVFRADRPEMLDVAWCETHFDQRHAVQIMGVNCLPGEGFDQRRSVEVAIGCCMLIARGALEKVGLFDEDFFAYHEDVDWCIRARRAGFELFYEPLSRVLHGGSSSTTDRAMPADFVAAESSTENSGLANASALPWNPTRTYLGIRNTLRLLGRYANKKQRLRFARACVVEMPLEFTSLLMNRRGPMKLGTWTWQAFFEAHFVAPYLAPAKPGAGGFERLVRTCAVVALVPVGVLRLPGLVADAQRRGRLTEFWEYVRGLRDGVLGRPLPLARLGLR